MKPFGKCSTCEAECGVLTETNAKVIHCPDFEKKMPPAQSLAKKDVKTDRNQVVKKQTREIIDESIKNIKKAKKWNGSKYP